MKSNFLINFIPLLLIVYIIDILFVMLVSNFKLYPIPITNPIPSTNSIPITNPITSTNSIPSTNSVFIDDYKKWHKYIIWILIASIIYYLVLSNKNDNIKNIVKNSFITGIVIFGIYGLGNLYFSKEIWSYKIFGIDILRGIIVVTLSSIIYHFANKILSKFVPK
jgi:uncharacterized membrane protein